MSVPPGMSQCDDFMMFQMAMKEMRQIDDNIVYALNNSIPTVSFKGQIDAATKCQELCSKIESTYDLREGALSKCIAFYQEKVNEAKSSANRTGQRIAQTHLRLFKNEMSVEEVIRDRTHKIFYEKCRDHIPEPKFKEPIL